MKETVVGCQCRVKSPPQYVCALGSRLGLPEGYLQGKSVPILQDMRTYLEREQPAVPPKSPEGMAISYTLSN